MTEFIQQNTTLLVLERQPHFPAQDLTPANASMLEGMLADDTSIDSHASYLIGYHYDFFVPIAETLRTQGVDINNRASLAAFSKGYATLETVSRLVNPKAYDHATALEYVQRHHLDTVPRIGRAILSRQEHWQKGRPNTHKLIQLLNRRLYTSESQLAALSIGAQLAFEFERPPLDRV